MFWGIEDCASFLHKYAEKQHPSIHSKAVSKAKLIYCLIDNEVPIIQGHDELSLTFIHGNR